MPTGKKVLEAEESEGGGLVLFLSCGHEGFTTRKRPPKTQACSICTPLSNGRPKSKLIPKEQISEFSCNELLIDALRKLQERFDNENVLCVGDIVTCKVLGVDGDNINLKVIGKL